MVWPDGTGVRNRVKRFGFFMILWKNPNTLVTCELGWGGSVGRESCEKIGETLLFSLPNFSKAKPGERRIF